MTSRNIRRVRRGTGGGVAAGFCAGVCVIVGLCAGASAAPLDAKTCEQLKIQQAQAAGSEARTNQARGAAWARDNLSKEKIAEVIRLIDLDEKVLFRCPVRKVEAKASAAKAQGAPQSTKTTGKATGKKNPGKSAVKAKPANPAQIKAAGAAAKSPPASRPAAKTTTKPAKPKADDAYVPPRRLPGFEN